MRPINRVTPKLGAEAYKTYQILAPVETHFRSASCEEVDCAAYRFGWSTRIDETTELGKAQASYIRHRAGRGFHETSDAGLTVFEFYPGQTCFDTHRVRLDREEVYATFRGDHRGRVGEPRIHRSAVDWVEDFAEHQQTLARGQT